MNSSVYSRNRGVYSDLQSTYRSQRVWAEGKGRLVVAAHTSCGAGSGSWLLGLVLGSKVLAVVGLVATVVGCLLHLAFLGHPERVWRMARRPRTSWISRGLLSTIVFIPAGLLFLIPSYVTAAPWDTWGAFGTMMLVISLIGMGGVLLSSGFVYAAARPVALWNSPLQPLSSIAVGVRSGAALALICLPFVNFSSEKQSVQTWWLAATACVILLFVLEIGVARGNATVAWSLHVSHSGRNAWLFFVGWLLIGILVPGVLVIASYAASLAAAGFVVAGVASLMGDLAFRYDMNLAGFFVPLVSPSQGDRGRYAVATHARTSRGLRQS